VKLAERIAQSQVTDDLGESKNVEDLADVDIIRACGVVAAKYPIGVSVWRIKYAKDTKDIKKVVNHLIEFCMSEKLVPDRKTAQEIVKTTIKYWFDPICDNCSGLGYLKVTGAPVLSDHACVVCNGSGQVKLPLDDKAADEVLQHLNKLERVTASQIFTKLRD
jgi:hypothetical protein